MIKTPPDSILQAYAKLISECFLYLRNSSNHTDDASMTKAGDLADAMHNIGGILTDYGGWTDDEKYRALYLRPYDKKWGDEYLHLEQFLDKHLDNASQ